MASSPLSEKRPNRVLGASQLACFNREHYRAHVLLASARHEHSSQRHKITLKCEQLTTQDPQGN
jgi:hypothetical protein